MVSQEQMISLIRDYMFDNMLPQYTFHNVKNRYFQEESYLLWAADELINRISERRTESPVKTVGSEITELDQMRAFSVAMATAVTVILASQLGLPVSSTHIAIGGVFGVGFLREALDMTEKNHFQDIREKFKKHKKELENLQKDLVQLEAIKDK